MGYYASFDGIVILSTELDPLETMEKAEDIFSGYGDNVEMTDLCDTDFTLLIGGYENYHEEEIIEFLRSIEPYTISGEISYIGDDNSFWRQIYVPERKEWLDQVGEIVYESGYRRLGACPRDC